MSSAGIDRRRCLARDTRRGTRCTQRTVDGTAWCAQHLHDCRVTVRRYKRVCGSQPDWVLDTIAAHVRTFGVQGLSYAIDHAAEGLSLERVRDAYVRSHSCHVERERAQDQCFERAAGEDAPPYQAAEDRAAEEGHRFAIHVNRVVSEALRRIYGERIHESSVAGFDGAAAASVAAAEAEIAADTELSNAFATLRVHEHDKKEEEDAGADNDDDTGQERFYAEEARKEELRRERKRAEIRRRAEAQLARRRARQDESERQETAIEDVILEVARPLNVLGSAHPDPWLESLLYRLYAAYQNWDDSRRRYQGQSMFDPEMFGVRVERLRLQALSGDPDTPEEEREAPYAPGSAKAAQAMAFVDLVQESTMDLWGRLKEMLSFRALYVSMAVGVANGRNDQYQFQDLCDVLYENMHMWNAYVHKISPPSGKVPRNAWEAHLRWTRRACLDLVRDHINYFHFLRSLLIAFFPDRIDEIPRREGPDKNIDAAAMDDTVLLVFEEMVRSTVTLVRNARRMGYEKYARDMEQNMLRHPYVRKHQRELDIRHRLAEISGAEAPVRIEARLRAIKGDDTNDDNDRASTAAANSVSSRASKQSRKASKKKKRKK